jgi:hypothetical protein
MLGAGNPCDFDIPPLRARQYRSPNIHRGGRAMSLPLTLSLLVNAVLLSWAVLFVVSVFG